MAYSLWQMDYFIYFILFLAISNTLLAVPHFFLEMWNIPLTRLERATCGLGNRRSIRLSYRGNMGDSPPCSP